MYYPHTRHRIGKETPFSSIGIFIPEKAERLLTLNVACPMAGFDSSCFTFRDNPHHSWDHGEDKLIFLSNQSFHAKK
jgi:hypothetical protein